MTAGNFTGITGIPTQDMAMWESMGPIADRSQDKLGSSDLAVVQFRRLMLAAAKKVRDGEPAIGATEPRVPHVHLASFEGVVEKTVDWRALDGREPRRYAPAAATGAEQVS
jgi:phthalate 4,5-dioxygenase oxygenase subunit